MKQKDLLLVTVLVIALVVGIALGAAKTAQRSDVVSRRDEARAAALELAGAVKEAENKVKEMSAAASPDEAYNKKLNELEAITAESKYRQSEVTLLQEVLDRSIAEIERKGNVIEARTETLSERDEMILRLSDERDKLLEELMGYAEVSGVPIATPAATAPVLSAAPDFILTGSAYDGVVVATVGDREIYYSDVVKSFMQYRPQYEKKYDLSDKEVERMLMMNELDYVVEQVIVSEWAKDIGIEADPGQFAEDAEALYNSLLNQWTNTYMEAGNATREEAGEMAAEYLESHYYTRDQIAQIKLNNSLNKRLKEHFASASAPSEPTLRGEFDRLVEAAKARYEASPDEFDYDIMKPEPVYYYPPGYRVVKHLMFKFSEEEQNEAKRIFAERIALSDVPEEMKELDARVEALMDPYRERLASVAEGLSNGVDFDELIRTFGEDSGMLEGITAERGYYVSGQTSAFGPEFRDAAMAIEKVAELSPPVVTEYGIHIIRYEGDAREGPADYDELKPLIEEKCSESALEDAYQNAYKEWLEKSPVVKYINRAVDPAGI